MKLKTLTELQTAIYHLNEASDALNARLTILQEHLLGMGIGFTLWHTDFYEAAEEEGGETWILGWAKVDGSWCLAASADDNDDFPLLKAPRIVRIMLSAQLESFLVALTELVQEYTQTALDATQAGVDIP